MTMLNELKHTSTRAGLGTAWQRGGAVGEGEGLGLRGSPGAGRPGCGSLLRVFGAVRVGSAT